MPMGPEGSVGGAGGTVVLPAQDIYVLSTAQLHKLGTRLQIGERVFRYALAGGTNLDREDLHQAAATDTSFVDMACGTTAANEREITVTNSTTVVTANMFAEGWLWETTATAGLDCYKIKKNTAAAASADFTVTLYDPIAVALAAADTIGIQPSVYYKTIVAAATGNTGMIVGTPLIDVTLANYYWCQTWGPAAVHVAAADLAVGGVAQIDDGEEGEITTADADGEQNVGVSIADVAAGDSILLDLRISP